MDANKNIWISHWMYKICNAKISINQGFGKIIKTCLCKIKKRLLDASTKIVVNRLKK